MPMRSGIRMIRDSVTRLGTLRITWFGSRGCVQVLVDALGERPADSRHLGDVVDRGGLDASQAPKMLDQRLAALGADSRDLVQHRGGARLAAARPVADHGEAVRLVANLLDEMQAGMRGRELEAALLGFEDELLHAGFALGALRHAHDAGLVQPQVGQCGPRRADLPSSAVDQDEVRDLAALCAYALVAALEHLAHGGVVVARRDAADVEAPVLRLL